MAKENRIRYSRLTAIDEIGKEGVERLKKSMVLVAGCVTLGSMAAIQLASSGVGSLRIIDFDTIDLSNLQRQYFLRQKKQGSPKCQSFSKELPI